jgi:PTS system N-acetylglucosamine-specific IIA component
VAGTVVALHDVPDPVFAGALVGPGLAIEPDDSATVVRAPVAGTLVKVKPHAFVVVGEGDRGVLVHLGIDTVKRNGAGFEVLASEGSRVESGDSVIRWDPAAIRAAGLSAVCPVVALDGSAIEDLASGHVAFPDAIFSWL